MVLHILLHMSARETPVTSEQLASSMATHAVVIRRTLAGLREAGLVRSEKGHKGGWTIARAPEAVTLRDIYDSLGAPMLFALRNRTESPSCLVEQAVNRTLDSAFEEAEALIIRRLGNVSLADLARDIHHDLQERNKREDLSGCVI